MRNKKWIVIAVIVALIAAAVAFVEFSGIRQDVENKIEEKKMWKSTSEELVERINEDKFFTNRYGKIDSWKIIERKSTYAEDGGELVILTLSCETETAVIQIYASQYADENWRYRVESVLIK